MANYNGITRTNYFSVKDAAAFEELIGKTAATEDTLTIIKETVNGAEKFGFYTEGTILGIPSDEVGEDQGAEADEAWDDDGEYNMYAFEKKLQELVADDDAIIITEVGNEKMRYLHGGVTVITSKRVAYKTLQGAALDIARESLENPDWQTRNDY